MVLGQTALWHTAAMGTAVGVAIYLGLPAARLGRAGPQNFLTSLALGALLLVVWNVLSRGLEVIENALHTGITSGNWSSFSSLAPVLALGLVLGLVGLAALVSTRSAPSSDRSLGPTYAMRMRPSQLAVIIAAGLGLHNFASGLALSHAAAAGPFAAELGLNNIALGWAIAAPLAFADRPPSWPFLGAAGLLGGGPVLLGTLAGSVVRSPQASVFFLAVGAGALFFVVGELFAVSRRFRQPIPSVWGIVVGFLAAYGVHLALAAAG